jgi:hypothetical protein
MRRGASKLSERSALPVLGAMAHAIANAAGVCIKDLPIRPEKTLKALRETRAVEKAAAISYAQSWATRLDHVAASW